MATMLTKKDADKQTARELFEKSIELKSLPQIRDVAGLAFAHGGLGRLAFYAETPDFETARKHFSEDLRYSEQIGSLTGQAKMHSMLAECDLREAREARSGNDEGRYQNAVQHYEKSFQLLTADFDKFFTLAGLIEGHAALCEQPKTDNCGQLLMELVQSRLAKLPSEQQDENPLASISRAMRGQYPPSSPTLSGVTRTKMARMVVRVD